MIALHSRQIMMARARNPYNAFDVLWLAYQVALFPGRSAMQGFQRDARCVVYNVLLLLPSLAMAFNVSARNAIHVGTDRGGIRIRRKGGKYAITPKSHRVLFISRGLQ
jgi:hypothetical protein